MEESGTRMLRYALLRGPRGCAWLLEDRWTRKGHAPVGYSVYEAADMIPALLRKLQMAHDQNAYISLNWLDSTGKTREEAYPNFYFDIGRLDGYVPEVCGIRREDVRGSRPEPAWRVEFPGELWMKTDPYTMRRVHGFRELMREDVNAYIRENGLEKEEKENG